MDRKIELKPSIVYSSVRFLEDYTGESLVGGYLDAQINQNKVCDIVNFLSNLDLFDIKKSKRIPNPLEKDVSLFQLIIFMYLKKYRPSWIQRFKKGLIIFEEMQTEDMDVYQCLEECGIFKTNLEKNDHTFYNLCSVLSRQDNSSKSFEDEFNLLQTGRKGELCSFNYESSNEIEPKLRCLEDNDLGYDLELPLEKNKQFIEVKSSVSPIDTAVAHISKNQINTYKRTVDAGINTFRFHFWSFDNNKIDFAYLAIIGPSDIDEKFVIEPEGVNIPIQEVFFNNFNHLFKKIDIRNYNL